MKILKYIIEYFKEKEYIKNKMNLLDYVNASYIIDNEKLTAKEKNKLLDKYGVEVRK